MSTCGDAVDESSTSASTSVSAISLSGIASPPMRSAASCARANVRFAIQTRSTPRERSVDARPGAHLRPRRPRAPSRRRTCRGARRRRSPRPTGSTRDGGRCRSRCAPACPTRPRGGTVPASCGAVPSRTAACHASRTWPRISLSPTIIESRPAATENRCATARVVVVRVEQVGEVFGRGARVRGEERADVADRGVEVRAARVDLDAVARGEHHDLEQVLARAEVVRAPSRAAPRAPSSARAGRPAPCGGSDRPRSETRVQELLRVGHTPGADEINDAGVERPLPIGVFARTPRRTHRFPGLGEQLEQGLVLRAELLGRAAAGGRRPAPGCGRRCRPRPRGRHAGPPTSS